MAGLTVKIKGDASQFDKTMSSVKGTIASISTPLGAITKVGAAIGAAFTAAAGAVAYAGYKLNSIGEEGRASDAKLKNVVQTMGLFGNQADVVSNRLLDVADATARKIGVDDDLIASTQAIVMSFEDIGASANIAGGMFDQVTKAALDMSVLFGGDATGYAVQLGKALSDPEKGLASLKKTGALTRMDIERIGGEFARTGNKGQAFADIIASINRQVSGQSEAVAKTSEKIKVSLSQVVESFAKPFSEGFNSLPAALESVFPVMSSKATELGQVVGGSIALALQGDSSKLAETGSAIGRLVADSILIGLQAGLSYANTSFQGFMKQLELAAAHPLTFGPMLFKSIGGSPEEKMKASLENFNAQIKSINAGLPQSNAPSKKINPQLLYGGASRSMLMGEKSVSTTDSINAFNDLVQTLRSANTTFTSENGSKFRPVKPGESSIYSFNGEKVIPILEQIRANTQPQAFPF